MRGSLAGGSRVSRQPYIAQHGARPSVALGRASLLNLCPPAGPVRGRRGVGVRVCGVGCAHLYVTANTSRRPAPGDRGSFMRRVRPSNLFSVDRTISDLPSHTRCCKRNTPPQLATARRSQRLYEYATDRRVPRARRARRTSNKRRRTRAESRGAPRRAGRALIHTDHSHDMPVGGSAPGVVHTWWFTPGGSHLVVHRNIAAKACIGHGSPRSCRNRQEERRIHSPHAPSCQDELGEVDRYVSRTYLGRISGDWLRRPNGAVAGVIAGAIAARRSAEGDGGRGLIRGDELFSFVSLVQDLEHLGAREWRARVARESGVIGGVISGVIGGVISGVISGNLSRKGICAPS
jgi:hypothetical protein